MKTLSRRHFLQLGTATAATVSVTACSGNEHSASIDTSLPVGPFGADATAELVTEGMDLSGKTALVTGCNSGLGYETMRVLALRGAHVIGTGRTLEKARIACDSVEGNTTPVALELSDFQSAVDCAETVRALNVPLDMLICNAGINFGGLQLVDGIELTFRVNHLGHFVLVSNLLPELAAAEAGRIVHVGSMSGYAQAPAVGIDFDNLRGEKEFDGGEAYGRSKLANALLSLQLSKNLQDTSTTSNVIHPGLVLTNIARNAPTIIRKGFEWVGPLIARTPAQGAATQVYVATNPILAGVSGAYFEDCNPVTVSGPHHIFNEVMAQQLWDVSLEMTRGYV
jgi:NAD(P)-dependent dehydrogenase (short-subunit alcohol dehydrogenase family)